MELENKDVNELFRSLGNIEAGVHNLNDRMNNLPCEDRVKALGTKVSWRQMWAIIITCMGIFFGALGLHYETTQSHAKNKTIHFEQKGNVK